MNKFSKLFLAAILLTNMGFAQNKDKEEVPKNWYQLDPATSGYNGISLDKAYELINSKKLKSKRIVVAVIDSGIDTLHEDLKPVLWTNPKEIPGNGIDDDHNGYVDDVHGWNFLGGKDGKNVSVDSDEGVRVYYSLKAKYADKTIDTLTMSKDAKLEYATFLKAKEKVFNGVDAEEITAIKGILPRKRRIQW